MVFAVRNPSFRLYASWSAKASFKVVVSTPRIETPNVNKSKAPSFVGPKNLDKRVALNSKDVQKLVSRRNANESNPKSASQAVKGSGDIARRPSGYRKQTVQDVWDNAENGSSLGTKACPTCGKNVEVAPGEGRRDWDVDHQPKWKDRDLRNMDRKQVLDEYNKDVQLRCPNCNRADN